MNKPALTEDEKQLLRNHFSKSPLQLIRLKSQTLLMIDEGLKQAQVGRFVLRKPRTIQLWLQDFKKRRLASLFSGHADNQNASKLTRKQKKEIAYILKQPPSNYGLPKQFWDVPQLKEYVKAEFGVEYESKQSYHFLLKFSGLSFKYPNRVSPRRNEKAIIKKIRQIRAEIKPYLKDDNWQVFTSDETGLQLEAEIRRAWLKKGKRTVVKTERTKQRQNYLGFLNQKTGNCEVHQIKRGKQIYIIPVLEKLVAKHSSKRICIIWDNATYHKGKLLREKLSKNQSLARVHLINLPPYAPETNPIEHVWQYAKTKIANKQESDFEKTKSTFLSVINSRNFNYKL